MRNYFTFDGVDSRSFGVYISGQGTFKAPARSYDAIEIPGRNGALLGIDSRLGNVELTYPAFIYSNFAENIAAFRAFLLSHKGYFKLKDSYHPDEFRLAYYPGPFEPDVTSANNAGSFDITFICKPQRYLESGQEVVELSPSTAQVKTYTGNIVEIEPGIGDRVTGLTVPFIPIQDLHGYSSPWPAGGGVNVINPSQFPVTLSGTNYVSVPVSQEFIQKMKTSGCAMHIDGTLGEGKTRFAIYAWDGTNNDALYIGGSQYLNTDNNFTLSGTISSNHLDNVTTIRIYAQPYTGNNTSTINNVYFQVGTDTSVWYPYSNICPISGLTGLSVYRTGKNLVGITLSQHNANNLKTNVFSLPKGTFAISVGSSITLGGMYLRRGSTLSAPTIAQIYNSNTLTVTLTEAYSELILQLYKGDGILVSDIEYVQIEAGSATTYEPYNGNTYAVDWTNEVGTVYGGYVNPVTGLLTVDRVTDSITKDSAWYGFSTGTGNASAVVQLSDYLNVKYVDGYSSRNGAISSTGKESQNYWINARQNEVPGDGDMCFAYSSEGQLRFHRTDVANITDLNAFKAAFPDTQICYYLATPITYQLSPHEITLIQNALNYIWSNAGPVTVEVTEGLRVTNPTLFDALPFLRVYGTGTLGMGSHTITITAADEYTDIDCEMMDCFKGSANKNQYVQFSGNDFPTLEPGVNGFSFSGITKVEVKPRWWSV